ncbi:hypothetical protein WJX64_15985 [Leifsonia sp. YIM 134122]|uniref:Uncharacterized protein n=1 Tax=Leifsonia stereocauli TaxID=3134136 RepID=A0ABU9WA56_9MICO
MSDLLPAVRPRGRHANPDVAVDAPSAASIAPAPVPEPASPVAEPVPLVAPVAEPASPVAEPVPLVAPVAEPASPVAEPVPLVATAETARPEPSEPFDSDPGADVDVDDAEVTDTDFFDAELTDDAAAPPEVDADEFANEPAGGEATVTEIFAALDAAREEPAPVVAVTVVESVQPMASAWAPPPWDAPAAPISAPPTETVGTTAGTPIASAEAPGVSSFAPAVATAVLDSPSPVEAIAPLPAPVPAVSDAPSPLFFGLAPAAGAAADETATAVADPIAAPTAAPRRQRGRVARGVLLSLLIIPVGIAAWVLLWTYGFITSVLAFGISWGAVGLYRLGSRARVTAGAFWAITGVILVTLALGFVSAIASDVIATMGLDPLVAATSSEFWSTFLAALATAVLWQTYAINLAVAVLFAGLGLFSVLKSLRPGPRA